jgi:hypothetical protein
MNHVKKTLIIASSLMIVSLCARPLTMELYQQLDIEHHQHMIMTSANPKLLAYSYRRLGYSKVEALIDSIEKQKNCIDWYVGKYQYKILQQKHPVMGKNAAEIACEVNNSSALASIKKHVQFARQAKNAQRKLME